METAEEVYSTLLYLHDSLLLQYHSTTSTTTTIITTSITEMVVAVAEVDIFVEVSRSIS